MRKIAIIVALLVSVSSAWAIWVNLSNNTVGVPEVIDGMHHPIAAPDFLYARDYRQADEPVPPAEGYERLTPVTWIQDTNDATRAVAVYHDTLIADRIARQHAEELARNFDKYVYQDTFLLVCDALTSSTNHTKLPMPTLTGILLQIRPVDRTRYENLRDGLNMLNSSLTRYSPVWWDLCVWESDTNVVSGATNLFNQIGQ